LRVICQALFLKKYRFVENALLRVARSVHFALLRYFLRFDIINQKTRKEWENACQ
jgi:hypothetical protein